MSTICGILYKNKSQVNTRDIKTMLENSTTRFHHEENILENSNIVIGQRHRYNTPESQFISLPHNDKSSGNIIVADCRIDNREELISKLNIEVSTANKMADAHFILKAYEKWGKESPKYLEGDFAFALWDNNKKALFCVRDHMGIKPLFYYEDKEYFIFASSVKCIINLPFVKKTVNYDAILEYIVPKIIPFDKTYFKEIFPILPAEWLTLSSNNQIYKSIYWSLVNEVEQRSISISEYLDEIYSLFKEAVKKRTRSWGQIGAELSGGIDSSGICSILAKLPLNNQEKIFTFSHNTKAAILNKDTDDVFDYVNAFLEFYPNKFEHEYIHEDHHINYWIEIQRTLELNAGMPNSRSAVISQVLFEKANKNGVSVLLSGMGGDQCVTKRYKMNHKSKTKWLPDPIIKLIMRIYYNTLFHLNIKYDKSVPLKKRYKKIARKKVTRFMLKRHKSNTDTNRMIGTLEVYIDNNFFTNNANTSDYFGIEYRYPMFDRKLIRAALSQPPLLYTIFYSQRDLFKKIFKDLLPPYIINRNQKTGFNSPELHMVHKREKEQIFENHKIIAVNNNLNKIVDHNKIVKHYNNFDNIEPGKLAKQYLMYFFCKKYDDEKIRN